MTTTTHRRRRSLAAGALLMSFALLATAAPVSAKVRLGHCSGSTDWEMEVYMEDGRIESELEIDHSHSGAHWDWTMKNDGQSSRAATRRSGPAATRSWWSASAPTVPAPTPSCRARSTAPRARSAEAPSPCEPRLLTRGSTSWRRVGRTTRRRSH